MSFSRFWAFLAVGLPALAAVIAPFPSVDLAYHLPAGGIFLDTGAIPRVDTFTFTAAGHPWLNQQWLAEVVLAAAFRIGGWTGLVVLRAALVAVAFGLLFDVCRERASSVRTAALLTLAAFVCAAITLGLRPQLFGVTLFAAVLWLLASRDRHPRGIWLVIPIVALWSNLHGSFVLGPAVVAIALLEDVITRRRGRAVESAIVLVASTAASLVNPFSLDVWTYAVRISTNSVITSRITEWQRTSILSAEGAIFYASLIVAAVVVVGAAQRSRAASAAAPAAPRAGLATTLIWLVPFAVLAIWAVRGLAWWPFVAAMTLAPFARGPQRDPREARRREPAFVRRTNGILAGGLVLAGIAGLPVWRPLDRGLQAPVLVVGTAPSGITAALRDLVRPGDRLLAPQPWGSWFEFAIPQAQVAVDSRIELFSNDTWDTVDRIETGGAGWQADLARWDVAIVVAPPRGDLAERLVAAGWRLAHRDDDGSVLVRPA